MLVNLLSLKSSKNLIDIISVPKKADLNDSQVEISIVQCIV